MPKHLLIVDDSPAMHHLVARMVSNARLPFECLFAGSGREALKVLSHSPVDLILTDINMPAMNGEEFVGVVRQDPAMYAIPIVVMSTDATRARISRMAAAGVTGYSTKPFTGEILCNELTRVLESMSA